MPKSRHLQAKAALPVSMVQVRFVYEGDIKGEWVNLTDALHLWIVPAEGYTVSRVEFNEKERR